ncbi:hypothetical protein D1794_28960 (plasmid) [Streptomyces clavuligerus]|nr:hypothetical protein D1794_28960 [Streptomyces clavuligerus]
MGHRRCHPPDRRRGRPRPPSRRLRPLTTAPRTLGSCLECYDGPPAEPTTCFAPPAKHLLAA